MDSYAFGQGVLEDFNRDLEEWLVVRAVPLVALFAQGLGNEGGARMANIVARVLRLRADAIELAGQRLLGNGDARPAGDHD